MLDTMDPQPFQSKMDGICATRLHCVACRTEPAWRLSLFKLGWVKEPNFACPFGFTAEKVQSKGWGTFIENLVKPIAKFLKLPCLDKEGQLKPTSGCAKRRDKLNQLTKK